MQKAACLNNLKQLGLAAVNYESSKERFPGYVQPVLRNDRTYVEWLGSQLSGSTYGDNDVSNDRTVSRVSWATMLLPELERQDIWDRIVDAQFNNDPVRPIEVFVCPVDSDATAIPDNAALSYVANTGAWDWVENASQFDPGDLQPTTGVQQNVGDWKENGVFFNLSVEPKPKTMRLTDIRDGAGTTLLLSENIHKNDEYSWFGVTREQGGEQHYGMVWVLWDTANQAGPDPEDQLRFSQEDPNSTFFSDRTPQYARPASNHPAGSFNVIFADGHGSALNADLDYLVYQQLLTSQGSKCVDVADPYVTPPSVDIQNIRRAPPLSESDYQ
jgi:hypothetical protein